MKRLRTFFAGLDARFAKLARRERIIVFVAAVVGLGVVLWALLVDPAVTSNRRLAAQVAQTDQQIKAAQASLAGMKAGRVDPDDQNRQRRDALVAELKTIEATLRATQKGLVSSDRMAGMLEGMLVGRARLQLVSLRTLPPAPLLEGVKPKPAEPAAAEGKPAPAPPGPAAAPDVGIYKHGVEITLQGAYGDLLDYLAALERQPTQMFWTRANLDGSGYPAVRLTLVLYTLSLDKTWLTV